MKTLLIEHRSDGWWYCLERDQNFPNRWQFGGDTKGAAIDQAHGRLFIQVGDSVKNLGTSEVIQFTS